MSTQQEDCAICHEEFCDDERVLPCAHGFHDKCITKWLKIKRNCPLCRAGVDEGDEGDEGDDYQELSSLYIDSRGFLSNQWHSEGAVLLPDNHHRPQQPIPQQPRQWLHLHPLPNPLPLPLGRSFLSDIPDTLVNLRMLNDRTSHRFSLRDIPNTLVNLSMLEH